MIDFDCGEPSATAEFLERGALDVEDFAGARIGLRTLLLDGVPGPLERHIGIDVDAASVAYARRDVRRWDASLGEFTRAYGEASRVVALGPGLATAALAGSLCRGWIAEASAIAVGTVSGREAALPEALTFDCLSRIVLGDAARASELAGELASRCAAKEFPRERSAHGAALSMGATAMLGRDEPALARAAAAAAAVSRARITREIRRWTTDRPTALSVSDFVDYAMLGLLALALAVGMDVPTSPFFDVAWATGRTDGR